MARLPAQRETARGLLAGGRVLRLSELGEAGATTPTLSRIEEDGHVVLTRIALERLPF